MDGVVGRGGVSVGQALAQSVDLHRVPDHLVDVDADCLVDHHVLLFLVASLLQPLIYRNQLVASTEALNLGLPAAEERSERVVDSGLDLVAKNLKVEEDLDAFNQELGITCFEGLLEPLLSGLSELFPHSLEGFDLRLDLR